MKRICVFCGSSPGNDPIYMKTASDIGKIFVSYGYGLVFGGGMVGLMGKLAKSVLDGDGNVIGVIPQDLIEREVGYMDLPDLRIVDSMHERKSLMYELSDGFIALPGGYGTFDEFFEILTWAQLGHHKKPCALLNTNGYFDKLIDFLKHANEEGFIANDCLALLLIDQDPKHLLNKMEAYKAPHIDKALHALKLRKSSDISK